MSGKMLAEALVEAISEVQFNANIKKLRMMLVIILALQQATKRQYFATFRAIRERRTVRRNRGVLSEFQKKQFKFFALKAVHAWMKPFLRLSFESLQIKKQRLAKSLKRLKEICDYDETTSTTPYKLTTTASELKKRPEMHRRVYTHGQEIMSSRESIREDPRQRRMALARFALKTINLRHQFETEEQIHTLGQKGKAKGVLIEAVEEGKERYREHMKRKKHQEVTEEKNPGEGERLKEQQSEKTELVASPDQSLALVRDLLEENRHRSRFWSCRVGLMILCGILVAFLIQFFLFSD